ncbi:MAG: alpha/beta hydrolase [Breznakiellaceae bacterium]
MQYFVEFERDQYMLRGILHKPQHVKEKIPIVIFIHGFMADKCEHYFSFVETARELEKSGIASLRFDCMGSGESDGYFEDMSVETEIKDSIAAINFVEKLEFVDQNKIGLLGMSLGGLVASLVAGRTEKRIKSLCLWAPAFIAIQDALAGHAQGTDLTPALTEGIADLRGFKVGRNFVEDLKKIRLQEEVPLYKGPVAMIWGEQDPIVSDHIVKEVETLFGRQLIVRKKIPLVGHLFESIHAREIKLSATLDFFSKTLCTQ